VERVWSWLQSLPQIPNLQSRIFDLQYSCQARKVQRLQVEWKHFTQKAVLGKFN
jgi:hypothetical protein